MDRGFIEAKIAIRDENNRGERVHISRMFLNDEDFYWQREQAVYELFRVVAKQIIEEEKWEGLEFLGFKVEERILSGEGKEER